MMKQGKVTDKRKDDTSRNIDGVDDCVQRQLEKEKNLYPLRITNTTVIFVTKDKCNREYAERYRREKMRL